jgi:hypothetical protein
MPIAYIKLLRRGADGGLHPDNSLPEGDVDPGWGVTPPVDPGFGGGIPPIGSTLPEQPPQVWPPISWTTPIVPIGPDNTLPVAPGTIWPPVGRPIDPGYGRPDIAPGHPDAGLPTPPSGTLPARPPVRPGHDLPGGGHIDNGLPSRTYWMIAYCPSLGWKFVTVDPSLVVGYPLPPAPAPK